MKVVLVKVGRIPRKSGQLIGLHLVSEVSDLVARVERRFAPDKCLYLPLTDIAFAVDMVGRVRSEGRVFLDSAFLDDHLAPLIAQDRLWLSLQELKEGWE